MATDTQPPSSRPEPPVRPEPRPSRTGGYDPQTMPDSLGNPPIAHRPYPGMPDRADWLEHLDQRVPGPEHRAPREHPPRRAGVEFMGPPERGRAHGRISTKSARTWCTSIRMSSGRRPSARLTAPPRSDTNRPPTAPPHRTRYRPPE